MNPPGAEPRVSRGPSGTTPRVRPLGHGEADDGVPTTLAVSGRARTVVSGLLASPLARSRPKPPEAARPKEVAERVEVPPAYFLAGS